MLAFLLITILLGRHLSNITVRNSVRDLLSGNQDTYNQYEAFLTDFGGNATGVLELEQLDDPSALAQWLPDLMGLLEEKIAWNNLVLLADEPEANRMLSPAKVEAYLQGNPTLKQLRIALTPQNSNRFESQAARISIECATVTCENQYFQKLVEQVQAIISQDNRWAGQLTFYGSVVFNEILKATFTKEMGRLFLLAFCALSLFSLIFLARLSGVVLTLIALMVGLIWSFSLMGLLNIPISAAMQLFPFFILVVGTCYIIHFLTIFYQYWSGGDLSKTEAIIAAFRSCSRAILGAALTTFLGLLSFCLIEVNIIAQLGLISALGTLCMTAISVLLVPALLAILPLKMASPRSWQRGLLQWQERMTNRLIAGAHWSIQHKNLVLIGTIVLLGCALTQLPNLRFVYNPLDWLPRTSEIGQISQEKIDQGKWYYVIELILDSQQAQGLFDSGFQQDYQELINWMGKRQEALGIVDWYSLGDVLPDSISLQELANQSNLGQTPAVQAFTDPDFRKTKLQIGIPWGDHRDIIKQVKHLTESIGEQTDLSFHFTGKPIILGAMASNLIRSLNSGYLFAFVTVFLVLFLLLRQWKLNLLTFAPNLLPIALILGLLGLLNVPLDVLILLTSTILLSISVDDTLHLFLHMKDQLEKQENQDAKLLFSYSHQHVGFSILATSTLIAISFGLFSFSSFPIMRWVGIIIAVGAVLAFFADLFLVPALYSWWIKKPGINGDSDSFYFRA